jgi:hypothetical protein
MVDLPTWESFIDSGMFDALEQRTLEIGDHVMTKDNERNKRVEAVDMSQGIAQINNGKKIYDYPIEDIRHTDDVAEAYMSFAGLASHRIEGGKYSIRIPETNKEGNKRK